MKNTKRGEPGLLGLRARVLQALRRWDEAVAALRQLADSSENEPQKVEFLLSAAEILEFDVKDLDGAKTLYEEALRLRPDLEPARLAVARALRSSTEPLDEAALAERLMAGIRDADTVAHLHVRKARALLTAGLSDDALQELLKALEQKPASVAALSELRRKGWVEPRDLAERYLKAAEAEQEPAARLALLWVRALELNRSDPAALSAKH